MKQTWKNKQKLENWGVTPPFSPYTAGGDTPSYNGTRLQQALATPEWSVENYLGHFVEELQKNGKSTKNCQQSGRAKRAPSLLRQFFVLFRYFLQFFQKWPR